MALLTVPFAAPPCDPSSLVVKGSRVRRGGEEDEEEEEEEEEEEDDDGMEGEELGGEIVPLKEQLRCCCQQLSELHWLPLIESTLSSTLHAQLAKLHRRCKGNFEERMLHSMLDWLDATVTSWLRVVLQPAAPEAPPSSALQQWQVRLRYFIMQSLAALRTTELFDIIIDFPDSLPAVSDLKECLQHTHQHAQVVSALSDSIDQRLLKPGTDTSKIIQVYVAAIKALRHLDPSGVTLETVSETVRAYLKARADTIRQVVAPRAPCCFPSYPLLPSYPAASFLPRCFLLTLLSTPPPFPPPRPRPLRHLPPPRPYKRSSRRSPTPRPRSFSSPTRAVEATTASLLASKTKHWTWMSSKATRPRCCSGRPTRCRPTR